MLENIPEKDIPKIFAKQGVNPNNLILVKLK